ncbi:hypothetical protein J6Q66_01340 [bacterium]|nr:hypothetical protein [bacterium]
MNVDNMILKFIEISRTCNVADDLLKSEQDRIKKLYNTCLSAVIKEYDADSIPSLIICNTYNKYSTVLPVKLKHNNYKYYILYDCYLTEINRLLNALYFDENDSGHDIWKLSYELFAEDAMLENRDILLSYYGLNNVALGPFKVNIELKNDLNFINDVQERYIIGHELGHWIYKASVNAGNEALFNINFEENGNTLLNDIHDILCELYVEYSNIFSEKDYIELIHEHSDIINENSSILEECFSDAIAYAIVFNFIQTKYNDETDKKIMAGQALFLGIMNLQLLAMQHMSITEESFESSVSIRIGFFRNYVGLYFDKDEKLFEDMIQKTIIRYEKRIANLLLECFLELENRADNIYDGLIDVDGLLDMRKVLGLANTYHNSDLIN